MPLLFTLALTKLSAKLSRLAGRGGGQALPGWLAEYLDPHLAGRLAAQLGNGVILVTGTNGKTTTTKLLVTMLEASGEKVLSNSTGSNLKRGITSAFIGASRISGRLPYTVAVLEVDEASLRRVAQDLQPKLIIVLNLFRDQLDRYGELDTTAAMIGEGIAQTQADLCLNADDPLVASLASYASVKAKVHYFGVDHTTEEPSKLSTVSDSDRCPRCRGKLQFSRVFYGHIGHYKCMNNDFFRPKLDVRITSTSQMTIYGSRFNISSNGRNLNVDFSLPGLYNLYNALAAIAGATVWGIAPSEAVVSLANSRAAFGRVERIEFRERTLCLLLIKNPAGFSQVIQTFLAGRSSLPVLFIINDLDADGRDVSWLWDVPLEVMAGSKFNCYVAGIRAADMALRLKYAGLEAMGAPDFWQAIEMMVASSQPGDELYILPTYTAMTALRHELSKSIQIESIV